MAARSLACRSYPRCRGTALTRTCHVDLLQLPLLRDCCSAGIASGLRVNCYRLSACHHGVSRAVAQLQLEQLAMTHCLRAQLLCSGRSRAARRLRHASPWPKGEVARQLAAIDTPRSPKTWKASFLNAYRRACRSAIVESGCGSTHPCTELCTT